MKAHQRKIREKLEQTERSRFFGDHWKCIDTDITKAVVKRVDYQLAKQIILKYEWLGTMPYQVFAMYGIFWSDFCGGVVCFSDVRHQTMMSFLNKPACILARGACVHWAHPHAGSFLISHACKMLDATKYHYVVAYADPEAGEIGTLYQACNWICTGTVQAKRWVDPKGNIKSGGHHRNIACRKSPKVNGKRTISIEIAKQVKEELLEKGWKYENGPVRYRYVLPLGTGKILKARRKLLEPLKTPYPKREECLPIS